MSLPEMPAKLRQRPKYKGMPIPFTTFVDQEGKPDFRVVDEYNRMLCIERARCGLCGQDLKRGKTMVFIGGEQSCGSGMFLDPAMHEDCAKYAAKVCPYLAVTQTHSERESPNAQMEYAGASAERPKKMGIYYCTGYKVVVGEAIYIKAYQATKIDYDTIPVGPDRPAGAGQNPAQQNGVGNPTALSSSDFLPSGTTIPTGYSFEGESPGAVGDQGAT